MNFTFKNKKLILSAVSLGLVFTITSIGFATTFKEVKKGNEGMAYREIQEGNEGMAYREVEDNSNTTLGNLVKKVQLSQLPENYEGMVYREIEDNCKEIDIIAGDITLEQLIQANKNNNSNSNSKTTLGDLVKKIQLSQLPKNHEGMVYREIEDNCKEIDIIAGDITLEQLIEAAKQ